MGDAEVVIIDCLTLLISNLLHEGGGYVFQEQRVAREIKELIDCLESSPASFIIVSNEVGLGLVPAEPLGRRYRDLLGIAHQRLAGYADEVYIMFAGIPVKVKPGEDL
jgi:adenosylcobinamide kinase/adenosylcobinamide-phosphate guanylyltransferase